MWMNSLGSNQIARTFDDKIIVFRRIDDIIVFATGEDEYDELVLVEVVDFLVLLISLICEESKGSKIDETWLLEGNIFGKILVAIDEMMPGGVLEVFDLDEIINMA
eukprot:CAMPEP_0171479402 /NCGR_PEP_ID=MMETSP0946-20130122/5402_1 /TAXON_ID=109269 /ORGANISM="Vaucheria litorea, Strain CCMP2940" /LENGTH=105 /DNA_ID=CAMNT_0012010323 /DNA_START=240 /DNA_END=554 /DNA_ORIENTATION=+